jgi:cell division transport system ATP-binding protein
MIVLKNVTKIYPPDALALNNINLHIKPKEFVSLVGMSGTGKTTIVKIITAEESVTQGQIIVGGWDITTVPRRKIPFFRRQVGVVYQDFKLLRKKTVYENVAFALQVSGASYSRIKKVVPQVLKIVGLESKIDRYPLQLSGGEQQRVAIARSLVHAPKLLVADEPTGNLDKIHSREIVELLLKINQIGTTVLFVSHDPSLVNYVKRRVITLEMNEEGVGSDQKIGKYKLK